MVVSGINGREHNHDAKQLVDQSTLPDATANMAYTVWSATDQPNAIEEQCFHSLHVVHIVHGNHAGNRNIGLGIQSNTTDLRVDRLRCLGHTLTGDVCDRQMADTG